MTEHELIDYGVSVGWLTPEKAEELKKQLEPERKSGHWENGHCSFCGEDIAGRLDTWSNVQWFIFCPRCGSRMDGEQDGKDCL